MPRVSRESGCPARETLSPFQKDAAPEAAPAEGRLPDPGRTRIFSRDSTPPGSTRAPRLCPAPRALPQPRSHPPGQGLLSRPPPLPIPVPARPLPAALGDRPPLLPLCPSTRYPASPTAPTLSQLKILFPRTSGTGKREKMRKQLNQGEAVKDKEMTTLF